MAEAELETVEIRLEVGPPAFGQDEVPAPELAPTLLAVQVVRPTAVEAALPAMPPAGPIVPAHDVGVAQLVSAQVPLDAVAPLNHRSNGERCQSPAAVECAQECECFCLRL